MKYLKYGSVIIAMLLSAESFAGLEKDDPLADTPGETAGGPSVPVSAASGPRIIHATVNEIPGTTTRTSDDGDAGSATPGNMSADDHDQRGATLLVGPNDPHFVSPHTAGASTSTTSTPMGDPPSYESLSQATSSSAPTSLQAEEDEAVRTNPRLIALRDRLTQAQARLQKAHEDRVAAEQEAAERLAAAARDAAVDEEAQELEDQIAALNLQTEEEEREAVRIAQEEIDVQEIAVREEVRKGNAHDKTKYSTNSAEGAAQRVSDAVFGEKSEAVRTAVTEAGKDLRESARDLAKDVRHGLKKLFGRR